MSTWNPLRWLRASSPTAAHRRRPQRPAAVRLLLERLEDRITPSLITVTSNADSGANTLRAALASAATNDTIDFAANVRTIDLTSAGLTIATSVTIMNDMGTGPVTIDGGGSFTVFTVNSGITASLSGLTITHGHGSGGEGGGIQHDGAALMVSDCTFSGNSAAADGGAIDGGSNMTVTDCTFSGNSAADGGAIDCGTLMVSGCTFSGNTASDGGAIDGGTITVNDSTFSGNSANDGGAIDCGTLTVGGCTFSGNSANDGGAIDGGTMIVNNSTFSGNTANNGGGIEGGTLTVGGCTFSGNSANDGGAIDGGTMIVNNSTFSGNTANNGGGIEGGSLTASDSTFSGNRAGDNLSGSGSGGGIFLFSNDATLTGDIVAGNFKGESPSNTPDDLAVAQGVLNSDSTDNLIGTGGSGGLVNGVNGNQVGVSLIDVGLAPLGNYGGPTQTFALLPGSLAIGMGLTFTTPTTDQRGLPRPVDSPSDVGAFQTQAQLQAEPVAVFNFPVGAGNASVGGPGTGVHQEQPGTGLQPLTAGNASALALGLVNRQATTLATNADGDVAAEFADGYGVFRYMSSTQTWTRLSTGYATALAIDDAGDVVGEFPYSNDGFEVHRWTDAAGNFSGQVAVGRASLLAGDANGDVVGEFANGPSGGLAAGALGTGVYEFTFANNTVAAMTWLSSGAAVQLAMDAAGDAFGAFTNGVWEATTATHSMVTQLTPGYAPLLAADAAGDVAGYFPYGRPQGVYEYTTGAGAFAAAPLPAPGAPTLLAMDAGGDLFGEFPGRGAYEAAAVGGGFTTQLTSPLVPATEDDASALA